MPSSRSGTSACATRSSSAAIRARSCAARCPAGSDVVPLRALRLAAALQRMRGAEDFQALAVLFKRVKNIARELKAHAPLERAALTEPAELALLAELDARRPRIEQAAQAADYRQAFTDLAGAAAGRRSVLHGSVRHGRGRAGEDRAADADGGLAQSDLEPRRHLGNRSSNGVGQSTWQRSRHGRVGGESKSSGGPKASPKRRAAKKATCEGGEGGQVRLPLRPQDGRQRIDEGAARRQGREPRRDVPHRPASASRLHGHDRGLHLLLRQQAHVSTAAQGPDGGRHRRPRAADRQEVRRSRRTRCWCRSAPAPATRCPA